jgi:flagellar secretion chaperone FliS
MAVAASYQNAARYRQAQVETASPAQLLVMLYDGAIRFLTIAREKMASGELEARHTNLIKAQKIIAELLCSLNLREGGEVAVNLQRVYTWMLQQLVDANMNDRRKPIDDVEGMLKELRESWAAVALEDLSSTKEASHANN